MRSSPAVPQATSPSSMKGMPAEAAEATVAAREGAGATSSDGRHGGIVGRADRVPAVQLAISPTSPGLPAPALVDLCVLAESLGYGSPPAAGGGGPGGFALLGAGGGRAP